MEAVEETNTLASRRYGDAPATGQGVDGATRLLLVRHGQSESNVLGRFAGQLDSPLTELGRSQAQCAADRLREERLDIAYSSPLTRARDTAKVICSALKLEHRLAEEFKEMCFGPWQGRKIASAEHEWPVEFGNFRRAPQRFALVGAETFLQLEARVVAGMDMIAKRHPGKRVLVVSHGVAIKVLLLHLRGEGLGGLPGMETMGNGDHVEVVLPPTGETNG